MIDWNGYLDTLGTNVGAFAKAAPDTMKAVAALDDAAAKIGSLDAKTRELISIAVAVTTRCDGCIAVHTKAAVEAGATRSEIAEALSVAMALNAGAALVYSSRALDAATNAGA